MRSWGNPTPSLPSREGEGGEEAGKSRPLRSSGKPMSGLNPDAMNKERKGSAEYRREQDKKEE